MNNLIVKNLYIFSNKERLAKHVKFSDKVNIITSSQIDGNKRGKSVITKSIYHTLGAEAFFDKNFEKDKKTFVIEVLIKDSVYFILRLGNLFKIFDNNKNLFFQTGSATQLAEKLYELYDFKILLPNKNSKELVIAPTAYAYLLNFVDQDKMDGNSFKSFDRLGQFSNYKSDLILTHFGVYNEEYFNIIKEIEILKEKKQKYVEEIKLLESLILKISNDILSANQVPTVNIKSLEIELKKNEEKYLEIYNKLNKIKEKLMEYRKVKCELENSIKESSKSLEITNKHIKKINENHTCPYCESVVEDTLQSRIIEYSNKEEFLTFKITLESEIDELIVSIENEESKYNELIATLNKYEQSIKIANIEKQDILKMQGYMEIKSKFLTEQIEISISQLSCETELKPLEKKKKEYEKKKKNVNAKYYEFMKNDIEKFGLSEIIDDDIMDIGKRLSASGSNTPILTLIWHFNLLKLKYIFNGESLKFPIILDSPSNGELDENNRNLFYGFLSESTFEGTQYILSTLGYDEEKFKFLDTPNVIVLTNDKYSLLCSEDYNEFSSLLNKLMEQKLY